MQDAIDIDLIHIIMINPFDNTERKICELRYTSTAVINQCDYTSKISAVLRFQLNMYNFLVCTTAQRIYLFNNHYCV